MAAVIQRWLTGARAAPIWLLIAALAALPSAKAASSMPSSEYQLKAVFLFNFAQFVEWPPDAFHADNEPFVIGVLGDDPFGSYLDELVKGERIGSHPLQVRRYTREEHVPACHILFVCASEATRVAGVLQSVAGRHVLTVSDMDRFAQEGGMVRFVVETGKIRLRINVGAARAARLVISSKILRVATLVTGEKE